MTASSLIGFSPRSRRLQRRGGGRWAQGRRRGSFLTGLSRSGHLLDDIRGLRSLLSKYGILLALSETSEVPGNLTGGVKQGFAYDGLTQMAVQLALCRNESIGPSIISCTPAWGSSLIIHAGARDL